MTRVDPAVIARSVGNREHALRVLDKLDAEQSLLSYVRLVWPILEPGRVMVEGRALRMMCEALEAVEAGHIKKLLVNVPPGFMKSMLLDVMFPTWVWGPKNRPDRRFCSWSYSDEITIRDNVKKRDIITDPLYRELWGERFGLSGDQNEKKLIKNDRTGFYYAAGIHGGGTGHRGDFCFIDDPHKVKEAESETKRHDANLFVAETYPTRKNDDRCAFVTIMQRIHEGDVSGTLIAEELGYSHLCIPMEYESDHPYLWKGFDFPGASEEMREGDWRTEDDELAWEARFSRADVEDQKKALRSVGGDYAVSGQFQQRPTPRSGGMFDPKNWEYVDEAPRLVRQVRGWDLAATKKKRSPRTAGVLIGLAADGRVYITDCVAEQTNDLEMEQMIQRCAEDDPPGTVQDLPQDPGQAGKTQVQALKRKLHGIEVKSSVESGQKDDRARPLAAQQQGGNVYLVRGAWNGPLVREAGLFPRGTFKDRIDAMSRAYARLATKKKRKLGAGPEAL